MLTTLRIKNLALVEDLTLELEPGFNAITGETGAGKSILIGALNLVLGERADRTLIRQGDETCSVEAVFDVAGLEAPLTDFLEEHGLEPCEEQQLLLKRSLRSNGTNRQFINGTPTSVNALRQVGEWLVDIHGPHDHQSLLHPARQLAILDAYGRLNEERGRFQSLLQRRQSLQQEKSEWVVDEKTYAQQLDLLRFQSQEITQAGLQPEEEEELESEYHRASHAARLTELAQEGLHLINGEESSLLTQAGALGRILQEWQRIDPAAASLVEYQEQMITLLQELQAEISDSIERIELDPGRLQELEDRLNLIHHLKRKYGSTIDEVIAFGEQVQKKLQQLEQRDEYLQRINEQLREVDEELWEQGRELSRKRREVIPSLCEAVTQQLKDLGFEQSHFEIDLTSAAEPPGEGGAWSPQGLDTVEFQFAPNPGESPRALRSIASSGEMARVMLAIKTVLASEDEVPLLVFDEVDANVGGETALTVGEKMRQIGEQRQTLCITHLAPVAACAQAHYVVSKQTQDKRTSSRIERLDPKARVSELARMLGGHGQVARQHAEALLKANGNLRGR